jgi:aryl-alcohol dehydrogenase-like predicted oxidoreductase
MVKLCLGTANFGSNYGIDKHCISTSNANELVSFAYKNKINNIDTSFEYNNAHNVLKKFFKKKIIIHTKFFLNKKKSLVKINEKITDFNISSNKKIHSILFHNQKDALILKKIKFLKQLKINGLVKKVGVSVYDLNILTKILKLWTPDVVQIPVNPFNREFISDKILSKLKKKKIIIFGRSIFLKGLLVKNKNKFTKKINQKEINDWFELCKSNFIHPVKACLDFAKSVKQLDYIIVGVQELRELKEIVKFFNQPAELKFSIIARKKYKKIDLRKI